MANQILLLLGAICCCLVVATVTAAEESPSPPASTGGGQEKASLQEQVQLLEKQLTALTMRRREDYQLLENNLKKYILESAREFSDIDIQTELRSLR